MSFGKTAVAGLLLFLASAGSVCGSQSLEADTEIQARIGKAVAAIVKQDAEVQQRIEELRRLARGDRRTLLLQMILYLRESDSTEESMGGALVFHRLDFTPEEKLDAILPWMESSEPDLRRVLTNILSTIDRPEGGEPDFSRYESRLEESEPRPRALILYMYEVSPAAALSSMVRVYGDGLDDPRSARETRQLSEILARHEVSSSWRDEDRKRARSILERLSRDHAWWVRLYVVAILGQNSALASPAIDRQLGQDPDPLVREAANR